MKRRQKFVTLILTMVILLSLSSNLVNAAETKFSDVQDSAWYIESMYKLIETEAIDGFPDGTFKPQDNVAIDQFIKMVVIATGNKIEAGTEYWAQPYIDFAIENKLIESGEYSNYNRPITRGEMARILVRALKDEKYPENYVMYQTMIKDFGTTSDVFRDFILKAYIIGLMNGYPDKTFKYKNRASRAEAVTMVHRLIDQSERSTPEEPEQTDANGFIVPDLRIVYDDIMGSPIYYNVVLANYEKYLGKNYKVKVDCINYPELNVQEMNWGKQWDTIKINKYRTVDSSEKRQGGIHTQYYIWYLDRNRTKFKYHVGMVIKYKVSLDNGKIVKDYYIDGVIQDKEFMY